MSAVLRELIWSAYLVENKSFRVFSKNIALAIHSKYMKIVVSGFFFYYVQTSTELSDACTEWKDT